jgi:hypothetical protein
MSEATETSSVGASAVPPPPSPALLEAWKATKPGRGRGRRPRRTLFVVMALALLVPLHTLSIIPLRQDLAGLPRLWLVLATIIWAGAFGLSLASALLPPPQQVLPQAARASRAALLATLGLVAFGLLFTRDAASTLMPDMTWAAFAHYWWHCVSFGLRITAPVLIAGWLALRRLTWVGRGRLGMAIGAAGGALAGLTLHGICPFGGALHVGLAHGGGVAVGAMLGGALFLVLPSRSGSK